MTSVHRTLSDYNVQMESTLNSMSSLRDDTQTVVKTLTGRPVTLDVEASDAIDKVTARTRDRREGFAEELKALANATQEANRGQEQL